MFAPIYLDHNATTPCNPRVLEAMLPFWRERWGNPSSRHEYGRAARLEKEKMFGGKVCLELWVKVREGWSDDERALRSLGYTDE